MTQATPTASRWRWLASPQLQSVAWQALGSASTLAAAVWVTGRMGLAAQGEFGLAKSWFDAAAVAASLGLPQGLLHLQYRLKVPAAALRAWLARWVAGLALLAWPAALALQLAGQGLAAVVAASLPFGAAHLLARSLLLPREPGGLQLFGIATALPALLTLLGVGLFDLMGWRSGFALLLGCAAALTAAVSLALAWPRGTATQDWSRRALWHTSLLSWLQQALAALMAAVLLSVVAASGQGAAALGRAALGLQVYQVFVVLVAFASPLLFDRLARQDRPGLAEASAWAPSWMVCRARSAAVLLPLLLGLPLAAVLGLWLRPAAGAPDWLLPLLLMLPAGLAAVAARMAATVLLAQGRYAELSGQALLRLLLALGLLWPALAWLPAAAAVAAVLLLTEALTWWRCRHCLRRSA